MSYCRHNDTDSNVYVFPDVAGGYACCMCWLVDGEYHADTAGQMVVHLRDHLRAGHAVPERAFEALEQDIKEGA